MQETKEKPYFPYKIQTSRGVAILRSHVDLTRTDVDFAFASTTAFLHMTDSLQNYVDFDFERIRGKWWLLAYVDYKCKCACSLLQQGGEYAVEPCTLAEVEKLKLTAALRSVDGATVLFEGRVEELCGDGLVWAGYRIQWADDVLQISGKRVLLGPTVKVDGEPVKHWRVRELPSGEKKVYVFTFDACGEHVRVAHRG